MKMFKSIVLSMVLFVSLHANQKVHWINNIDTGIKIAQKRNIPILLFIYSNDCRYCLRSAKNFSVGELNKVLSSGQIVPISVSKGSSELFKYSFFTNIYPTYYLLTGDGKQVTSPLRGYVQPDDLAIYLKKFIQWYKNSSEKK